MSDHGHRRNQSQRSVEDLDSAGTTLVGSARSTKDYSFDGAGKYADIELDAYDRRQVRRRRDADEARDSVDEADEDNHEGGEHDRLLAGQAGDHLDAGLARTASAEAGDAEPPLPPSASPSKPEKVSWSQLPNKGQLAILTLARMSEPLAQTSLQSYMYYQLKSFTDSTGKAPSDSTVANQVGILAAAFTGAQFCTAILWGRAADHPSIGRKRVILIGLLGTVAGSLGFGFSRSFASAAFWRALGGILNGNIGVMRTMISEIVKEKKFQSRAFLLMPFCFNIGVIIGPLLGGVLADPAGTYPSVFGHVSWLVKFPYALPNIVNALFLFGGALGVILGLEETLEARREKTDWGRTIGRAISRIVGSRAPRQGYSALSSSDNVELANADSAKKPHAKLSNPTKRQMLPFKRMWTSNVCFTLLAHGMLAMHVDTFSNLWFVFLSTPRYDPAIASPDHKPGSHDLKLPPHYKPKLPFIFTGGLALPPTSIGTALAILGVIGISLQLTLYPPLTFRWGTQKSYRRSLVLFPLAYFLAPFLAILPSSSSPPHQASGALIWLGITTVLAIQVMARTFALPATAILINNATPHPSVLGTMHGVAQSVSSMTRTIGPILGGWVYGMGLGRGVVGLAYWCMAGIAVLGAVAGTFVREGDGHEIKLPGEQEGDEGYEKPP